MSIQDMQAALKVCMGKDDLESVGSDTCRLVADNIHTDSKNSDIHSRSIYGSRTGTSRTAGILVLMWVLF